MTISAGSSRGLNFRRVIESWRGDKLPQISENEGAKLMTRREMPKNRDKIMTIIADLRVVHLILVLSSNSKTGIGNTFAESQTHFIVRPFIFCFLPSYLNICNATFSRIDTINLLNWTAIFISQLFLYFWAAATKRGKSTCLTVSKDLLRKNANNPLLSLFLHTLEELWFLHIILCQWNGNRTSNGARETVGKRVKPLKTEVDFCKCFHLLSDSWICANAIEHFLNPFFFKDFFCLKIIL